MAAAATRDRFRLKGPTGMVSIWALSGKRANRGRADSGSRKKFQTPLVSAKNWRKYRAT